MPHNRGNGERRSKGCRTLGAERSIHLDVSSATLTQSLVCPHLTGIGTPPVRSRTVVLIASQVARAIMVSYAW